MNEIYLLMTPNNLWLIAIIFLLIVVFTIVLIHRNFKQYTLLNKYKNYQELFASFAEASYEIIYKDQVMGYTASGVNLTGDELETVKRNFVKLSLELMGPNIEKLLIFFYGTREVLLSNLLTFFQTKIDNDALSDFVKKKMNEKEDNK